jgi:hypothetical protein
MKSTALAKITMAGSASTTSRPVATGGQFTVHAQRNFTGTGSTEVSVVPSDDACMM